METGRLTRDGRVLRREDGSIWNWRGQSMFLLPGRWRAGEDVTSTIEWLRHTHTNVARVFPDWTIYKTNRGLDETAWVADYLRWMKGEGVRCEVTAVVNYDRPLYQRRRIVAALDEIVSDDCFHFFEVQNEPWNRGDDPRQALNGRSPRALTALGICPVNGPRFEIRPSLVSTKLDPALTGTVDEAVAYITAESIRCRGFAPTVEEWAGAEPFIRERFPEFDGEHGTGAMVNALLVELDRIVASTGSGSSYNYTDCIRRDYLTPHLPRDHGHYFRNGKDLQEMWGMGTFLVDDEPLGVADYDKDGTGARSTNRRHHVWHHTCSRLYGGSTIHSQFGLEGRAPREDEPVSRRIVEDIAAMWRAIPDDAYTGQYSRAGLDTFPLEVLPSDSPDDAHPGTGYASIHGNIAYVVVPKAIDSYEPKLINGWTHVERIGPEGCAIFLVTR